MKKQLNISIKEPKIYKILRNNTFLNVWIFLVLFAVFYMGYYRGHKDSMNEKPVPIITTEEFNEMVKQCQNKK